MLQMDKILVWIHKPYLSAGYNCYCFIVIFMDLMMLATLTRLAEVLSSVQFHFSQVNSPKSKIISCEISWGDYFIGEVA